MVKQKFDKIQYDRQYTKEHYSDIRIQVKKDDKIKDEIKTASRKMGITQNKFLYDAIRYYLDNCIS